MKTIKINPYKSIKQNKLIFDEPLIDRFGSNFIYLIMVVAFTIYPTLIIFFSDYEYNTSNDYFGLIFLISIYLIPLLIIIRVIKGYRLIRIPGVNPNVNRDLVRKVAQLKNWKIVHDNQNYLTATDTHYETGLGGQQITVIYDNNDLLLNSFSIGRYGMKIPFYGFTNSIAKIEFEKILDELIKKQHQL